jgi:hypothetical protein
MISWVPVAVFGGSVAFVACHLILDLSDLPSQLEELRVGFKMGVGNNKKPLLLIYPANDATRSPVAAPIRYTVYMTLRLSDGTEAGDVGQLIVSGRRLIGMVTHGSAGDTRLDDSVGSVYAFSLDLDDIKSVEPKTRWTGRVAGAVMTSKDGLDPGFVLKVTSVVGVLADSGRLTSGASFADLLRSVTPAGG